MKLKVYRDYETICKNQSMLKRFTKRNPAILGSLPRSERIYFVDNSIPYFEIMFLLVMLRYSS